ncbi:MAG TPA: flagellar FliJ family protein [Candidatus Didemnitutus sp.]|nr:flagellar FliJ family protein [Candidatus Didemnitutus sp.]
MKRFHFPLRPVTVIRSHREMRAREAFAAAVHTYVQAEENLASVRRRVAEMGELLFSGRTTRFLAADAAALFRVYRAECQAEIAAERNVIDTRDAMNKRRQEYIEANRQLKVVNRLEEKARQVHRVETLRAEQNELDDFAGFKSARHPNLS